MNRENTLLPSAIEAIGGIPLVELGRFGINLDGAFTGKTAVVLMCDSGLKYLSTDLWERSS